MKQIPAGEGFSGYLTDYSKLKPNPKYEGRSLVYVLRGPTRNIHQYVGVIVEPVAVYFATNADAGKIPDRGRTALAEYFRQAVTRSIAPDFPVLQKPGALVLRLRSALIGVDIGGAVPESVKSTDPGASLDTMLNIGKVAVEMELVDSETGEQVAAVVDRQKLGDGIVFGSVNYTRDESFKLARQALDGWAARIREFLDTERPAPAEQGSPSPQTR